MFTNWKIRLWTHFKYGRIPWQHKQSQLLVGKRKSSYRPRLEIVLLMLISQLYAMGKRELGFMLEVTDRCHQERL